MRFAMPNKNFRFAPAVLMSALLLSRAGAQTPPPAVTAWPLRVEGPSGLLTVYEPQPDKFEGDTLTARAAVSLTLPGATDPEFGALWMTARVFTDRDLRTVAIQNITIKQVKLPNATPDQETQFGQALQQQIPPLNVVLSLDQLEATLGVVQKAKDESKQLQNTPPKIIFTTVPSTLVTIDGPPKLQPADVANVMRVINTPFIMLLDLQAKQYFLKAGNVWQSAPDAAGPWQPTNSIPAEIADEGAKLVAAQPVSPAGTAPPVAQPAPAGPTQIIVSEVPAELIFSDGAPQYTPLPGNDLLYMGNTQADVFMEVSSQQYFVLLSGRWFQSRSLQGPWNYVASDKLPSAFGAIPPDSPKGNVLVSVAGTQPAKDARLDAYIPQTTAIRRDSGASLLVSYDGSPQFVPVENTPISYASNCADPVLFVNNSYYCCHQAVWYQSSVAVGPWVVATAIPEVIYTLPPSCPVYYCRYVYVYDSTPDVVYCGYLPGYTGCYVYGPTVVYGTGYQYPYWYGHQFYAHPYTWGFGARYDYYSGTWGLGASLYLGPTWFAGDYERRNWWGPSGYVDYHAIRERQEGVAYNVHDEHITENITRNVTVNRIDIYNRTENVKRNVYLRNDVRNQVDVHNQVNVRNQVVNDHREPVKAEPARPTEAARPENNVYAGHDGQIYRRTDKGWEANTGKGWSEVKSVPEAHDEHPQARPAEHEPVRETPVHEPAHLETPAHAETPAHVEEPRHVEQPAHIEQGGGLEAEHQARQRSIQRAPTGGDHPGNEHPAGGNNAGGSAQHGGNNGSGGGGNNANGNKH